MPNIGALLKQEIVRLSRREVRKAVQAATHASARHRGSIAALKRRVAGLEGQVAALQRRVAAQPQAAPDAASATNVRFRASGLKSHRKRLGLSAADYGRLAGVSAQSVYNWELGHATPRPGQVQTLAALRGVGKREALRRLAEPGAKR